MKVGDTVEILAIDKEEKELYRNDGFNTMKEARGFFRKVSKDRSFWVRHAESEAFPAQIETIQLLKNGEIIDDCFPCWK